mmetsp:Transcript_22291/g.63990  ORF Transcript_22291/g.63990 Transcript_22291/m.63990 type:complete len:216 (+) Transcript_22291:629-1276(+)
MRRRELLGGRGNRKGLRRSGGVDGAQAQVALAQDGVVRQSRLRLPLGTNYGKPELGDLQRARRILGCELLLDVENRSSPADTNGGGQPQRAVDGDDDLVLTICKRLPGGLARAACLRLSRRLGGLSPPLLLSEALPAARLGGNGIATRPPLPIVPASLVLLGALGSDFWAKIHEVEGQRLLDLLKVWHASTEKSQLERIDVLLLAGRIQHRPLQV